MPRHPKPTTAELQILHVLWRRGPSTVNQVQPELERGDRVAYTTVLKLLQIMFEKGLVRRDTTTRPHVFRAAVAEAQVKRRFVTILERSSMGQPHLGRCRAAGQRASRATSQARDLLDKSRAEQ